MDFENIIPLTLLTWGVSKYFVLFLDVNSALPQYKLYFKYAWLFAFGLLALASILSLNIIVDHYVELLLFISFCIIYLLRNYKMVGKLIPVILPYLIATFSSFLLRNTFRGFSESISVLTETAKGFSVLWLFGFGIYIHQQIRKDKKQQQKDEEERKALQLKRKELEEQVSERTQELELQKKSLEEMLAELKITQSQLIQSEKMASLGELTAGIAHEIQNPLNFVNNFSEVSNELIDEMKDELSKGNYDDAKAIADDVKQNLEKINHHGKRASSIVKGMLEHSRTSTGTKETTDINDLADEYLRLAYHGLRAKDKDFNAVLDTHFDPTLPKINVVSQDIGRVILNLITNAFYAVNERRKKGAAGYKPKVIVSTKRRDAKIEIMVKDNGNGIPESIKEKIFQPFFTTKPTGQGTGLGLSLAYDIVKAHGGELKVESPPTGRAGKEGEGTEFTISLPF